MNNFDQKIYPHKYIYEPPRYPSVFSSAYQKHPDSSQALGGDVLCFRGDKKHFAPREALNELSIKPIISRFSYE